MEKFTWVQTFEKISEWLLQYEYNQEYLIELLKKIGVNKGLDDQDNSGNSFLLQEIDPFSFIALILKHGEEKRNHRTQVDHLKRARAVQMVDYPNYEWAGRPSAKHIVTQWRKENPKGKKIDCNRDTKLDPKTIRKWWNDI